VRHGNANYNEFADRPHIFLPEWPIAFGFTIGILSRLMWRTLNNTPLAHQYNNLLGRHVAMIENAENPKMDALTYRWINMHTKKQNSCR
jgi:hypothetical protein